MKKQKLLKKLIVAMTFCISFVQGNLSVSYGMMQEHSRCSVSGMEEYTDEIKISSIQEPVIDASTGAVTFSYVYFGSYPQSEVTGDELTDTIINAEYVSGDAVVCGKKYRRLEQNNQYHYFEYEPIKWRVMWVDDNNIAMLRSESILDCKPYNADNPLEYGYSTSWVRTTIRCWLNGYEMYRDEGFLQSAFSEIEQYGIVDTTLSEENHNITEYVEKKVDDKVVLLNKWFLLDTYWNQETLIAKDTEYATASYNMGYSCNEWMIGTSSNTGFYPYADSNGIIHSNLLTGLKSEGEESEGITLYYMNDTEEVCGVCPALQLDLSYAELWMTEEEFLESSKNVSYTWDKGDVNKDGMIDLTDAQMVLRFSLNIEEYSKVQMICADMDGDGAVTLNDAQRILWMALKIDG